MSVPVRNNIRLQRGRAVASLGLLAAAAAALRQGFQAVVRSQCRRQSIRQLMAIDDATLADIGIRRSEIPSVVDELLRRRSGPAEGEVVASRANRLRADRTSPSDWRPIGTMERSRPV